MDDEYSRLLNLSSLPDLFACESGYMDANDCSWYHPNWILLRYLGMVSNPFWHAEFYRSVIEKYAEPNDDVFIIGTADFSMPLIFQQSGLRNIEISDLCNTPLNICKNVSEHRGYQWKTKKQNLFDGISRKYDIIANDAFITRFSYSQKRDAIRCIYDGLRDNGLYITTMRHDWNEGKPLIPNATDMKRFVTNAVLAAKGKGVNEEQARSAASEYIERMVSYPIRDTEMLDELISGLFKVEQLDTAIVPGEYTPTEYYRIVLRKKNA